jgi:hypothetical protein
VATLDVASLQERYERDTQYDNDGFDMALNVFGRLNRQLGLDLTLEQLRRDFTTLDRRDRDNVVRIGLFRQLGVHFVLDGRIERTVRKGGDSFNETAYRISLAYTPAGQYRPGGILE